MVQCLVASRAAWLDLDGADRVAWRAVDGVVTVLMWDVTRPPISCHLSLHHAPGQ